MAVSPTQNDDPKDSTDSATVAKKEPDSQSTASAPSTDSTSGGNGQPTTSSTVNTNTTSHTTDTVTATKNQANTQSNAIDTSDHTPGNYEDYTLMPQSPWPPPLYVKKNITPRERFYLENRWYSQWSWYDKRAAENKNKYFRLQLIIGVGSVVVPTLIGFNPTFADLLEAGFNTPTTTATALVNTITVVISLAVAISAAIEQLNKYGENWSSYRSAAEELQAEKSYYDMHAGPYHNNQNPFATFVERTEGIIAKQNGKYFETVQQQLQQAAQQGQEILDQYEEDEKNGGFDSPTTTSASAPKANSTPPTAAG